MLIESEDDIGKEFYDSSVNRSYYAMYHAVTAVLLTDKIERSSHSALIAAFDQFFVKAGKFDKLYSRMLRYGFELRNNNDYLSAPETSENDAKQLLGDSHAFVQKCIEYCKK